MDVTHTPSELETFCDERGVTIECSYYSEPPPWDARDMDGWKCRLRYQRRSLTVPFWMGRGHHGAEPTAGDVLGCLILDATGYENARDFEDWCSEYGYDTDSRKAERIYKAVKASAPKIRRFLGDDFEAFAAKEH